MAVSTSTAPPAPGSASASAAHRVLCDEYMFRSITSFQLGFPQDVVTLAHANDTPFRPRGWLSALVIFKGDLRMLERLLRLYKDQRSVFNEKSMLSFSSVWLSALEAGRLTIADWVLRNDEIPSDHDATTTLRFAIASGRVDVVEWLLQNRPALKTEFTPKAIRECPTIQMFQWLAVNLTQLPSVEDLIDFAADQGRLELVKYVFTHYAGCCTGRAVVGAASKGHLEVVQFLHEHAHDQCSCNAMRAAAWHGHLAIVQFLNENCSESHGDAFELAALSGHLDIVVYLARTRTDLRVMRAHALVAQSGLHKDVQAYLSAILNPATHRNALFEKPRQGPTRTDGAVCKLL